MEESAVAGCRYLNTQHIKKHKLSEADLSYGSVEPAEQLLEVGELGLDLWRRNMVQPLRTSLVALLLQALAQDREGHCPQQRVVQGVILSFVQADVSSEASLPLESATSSESGGLAPSASHDIAVQYRPGHSSVFAAASGGAVPVQRDDGEVLPKQKHTVQVHLPSESITGSESVGPAPSTSRDIAVQYRPGHSSVFAAGSAGAVPVQRDDGEVFPKQKRTVQVHLPSESMTGSESGDPAPSTSRDIAVQYRPGQSSVFAAASDDAMPAQRDDSELFPKQKRTVQ
ncbi:hypothetical protein V5799_032242, partial [Amblyomma americanum]